MWHVFFWISRKAMKWGEVFFFFGGGGLEKCCFSCIDFWRTNELGF